MKYSTCYITLIRAGVLLLATLLLWAVLAPKVSADNGSLSVTVTPPLYQLTISPGDSWTSTLKIINSNPYDVTFYAQIADMQANGEEGRSKFIPVLNAPKGSEVNTFTLARWIKISPDPIFVRAGASQELQFNVAIPQNAEPGGHYAAILVGTQPLDGNTTGSQLKVSSFVSSLMFVRVKGDVIEKGRIREFITAQQLYQTPQADFLLRFENIGNTHVRPQGDMTIYNMWGKERGKISVNQESDFGNVLPKTIRKFEFSWEGERDIFDIGLYSAAVTLAFGENGKQNVTARTFFWVVPVVPVAVGLSVILIFVLVLIWLIRRYIRRALELEQKRFGQYQASSSPTQTQVRAPTITKTLMQPIKEGVIDLRSVAGGKKSAVAAVSNVSALQNPKTAGQFLKKYRLFWLFVVILILGSFGIWLYFSKVLVHTRGFQISDVRIQEELSESTTTPAVK